MIVGYHLIWTAYGWWLPNDPRGSMSQAIASDVLAELGELHYGRKRIQPTGWVIRDFYEKAQPLLKHELLKFNENNLEIIAESFAETIRKRKYTCYASAIMPDHVHLLIRKHRDRADAMIEAFQEASRMRLIEAGIRSENHPVWGGPGWNVFLDCVEDIERTIRYIEQNPVKIGRPIQRWNFVTPYDGWLPGLWTPYRKK
jgi:REP element-mobilizing transposase RayT